jgi:sulfite exporter TauE/SafE/copper chaperone CopZ
MRCESCAINIENILSKRDCIQNVKVNYHTHVLEFDSNLEKNTKDMALALIPLLTPYRYTISLEKISTVTKKDDDIWKALPIGLLFLSLFFILQKSGVLNFGIGSGITSTTSFLIGIVASLSSCLAVVGGLVLSFSAEVVKGGENKKKPIIFFHIGRLLGFASLGGLLGLIGQSLGISFVFSAILGILASLVMLVLGLNLVGFFKKNKFTLPRGIFNFFKRVEHQSFAPLILGVGTFFLPCGFTQSMQVAALSSGSFVTGASIMFFFALGTFPMLALLSFGSASFAHSKYAPLFFKSAGVIVIGLGLFALISGLAGLGFINPLFNI